MKKQINKVLIALIFSTVVAPAYGSFGTDLAIITGGTGIALLAAGACGGAAALIHKPIIEAALTDKNIIGNNFLPKKLAKQLVSSIRYSFPGQQNNDQQPNKDNADNHYNLDNQKKNVFISGLLGGALLTQSSFVTEFGALLAYLCNAAYDRMFGKDNRDYNSNRTTFISGAIGATTPALIALTAIAPILVIMTGIANSGR